MKYGMRKPSVKKSIKARTTGRVTRTLKSSVDPTYGKKGAGWIKDPKRAAYNAAYSRTTVSARGGSGGSVLLVIIIFAVLIGVAYWFATSVLGCGTKPMTKTERAIASLEARASEIDNDLKPYEVPENKKKQALQIYEEIFEEKRRIDKEYSSETDRIVQRSRSLSIADQFDEIGLDMHTSLGKLYMLGDPSDEDDKEYFELIELIVDRLRD